MNRKFHFTRETRKRLADFHDTHPAVESGQEPETPALLCCALTDIGKVRAVNQDALVMSEELQLYGVADGMGGHKGGEVASAGARDALIRLLEDQKPALSALEDAISEANASLYRQQEEDEALTGMGTTLSVLWLSEHFAYMGHVGDSRIYRLRDGELEQLTDDHSFVGELVRRGVITAEEAEEHPMKNVILRALGTEPTVEADLAVEERRSGDTWLICSDGLHGLVSEEEMAAILTEHEPEKAGEMLLQAALDAGGHDNISLIILRDGEEEA